MKVKTILISWTLLFSSSAFAIENGSELFDKLCAICHVKQGQPTNAPPVFGMVNHVKRAYPNRDEFVERIVVWVKEPKAEFALMPGAIRKFGLMPKLGYSDNDVRLIAEYLYDGKTEFPEWYIKHYEEEHGEVPSQ
jgi:hypothetical protein